MTNIITKQQELLKETEINWLMEKSKITPYDDEPDYVVHWFEGNLPNRMANKVKWSLQSILGKFNDRVQVIENRKVRNLQIEFGKTRATQNTVRFMFEIYPLEVDEVMPEGEKVYRAKV